VARTEEAEHVERGTSAPLLERAPELLEALLDGVDRRVLVLDRQGRVVVFNGACERATGWKARELLGRRLWEALLEPAESAWLARVFELLRPEIVPPTLQMRWRTRERGARISTWTTACIQDEDGRLTYLCVFGVPEPERKDAAAEKAFHDIVEHSPEGVCVYRGERILYMNETCRQLLGLGADADLSLRTVMDFVRPDARSRLSNRLGTVEQGRRDLPYLSEWLQRLDGAPLLAELWAGRVTWEGEPATAVHLRDAAWRRVGEDQPAASADGFALALEGSSSGLWEYNEITHALVVSDRFKELLGYGGGGFPADPASLFALIHADDQQHVIAAAQSYRLGEAPRFEVEARFLQRDGRWRWFQIRGAAARLPDGTVYRLAGALDDIDARKQADRLPGGGEDLVDALTGLPSRAALLQRLTERIERGRKPSASRFAVLFLDVDRFQVLVDSVGHAFGDDVLVEIGRRLKKAIRMRDTAARFGGDEFTILLEEIKDTRDAARVAERIHALLAEPFHIRGRDVFVSVSVGIAVDEGHYASPSEVLRDADNAMYRAKALGRAQHVIFHSSMHLAALQQFELETDLHRALERDELVVHYQPIVRLEDGRIVGFEALVRWQHPRRGLVGPSDFIPMAEESGLIVPLGLWVIQRAMADLRIFLDSAPGIPDLWMAVNLSARQFQQVDLVERIREALEDEEMEPWRLKVEVTESTLMADPRAARHMLERLRALSVRVGIDDFGTGYSSLSHLRLFPLDALKIDRTFVSMLDPEQGGDLSLPRSILALAEQLGLEAIAEGVETVGQLEALRSLSCPYAQGFYFERPIPVDAVLRLFTVENAQES